MHLTDRLKGRSRKPSEPATTAPADRSPAPATSGGPPAPPTAPTGRPVARVDADLAAGHALHIAADGTLVIDLRTPVGPPPPPTSAMPCPTCGAVLAVDDIDHLARIAVMRCADCGLTFSHRLVRA